MTKVISRLYHGETTFDFVHRKKIWFLLSSVVIIIGIISLFVKGLNFSIDFAGGTSWTMPAKNVTVNQVRTKLSTLGLGSATIEKLGTGNKSTIQVQDRLTTQKSLTTLQFENKIAATLASLAHIPKNQISKEISISEVGPTWGGQITDKAIEALIIFFFAIAAFIALFFEWKMALSAMIAVVHDILVTVGIYSLSGFQVTPDTVVAFLTILGYSLYDTMVVFDRIRDNVSTMGASGRYSYSSVVNSSMNQVLARSINTSLVAIMPILAVLVIGADFLGATTLQFFGLALLIGLTTGAYSSIFIASPILAILKEREYKYREIRKRLAAKGEAEKIPSALEVARFHGGSPRIRTKTTDKSGDETDKQLVGAAMSTVGEGFGIKYGTAGNIRRKPASRAKRKKQS
jgi:preprotein translocase subunit SecF